MSELDIGPPTLEGAVVVAACGGELVGEGQGPLHTPVQTILKAVTGCSRQQLWQSAFILRDRASATNEQP